MADFGGANNLVFPWKGNFESVKKRIEAFNIVVINSKISSLNNLTY